MMTTKISPREWEAISAYLDGQLDPKERVRLETRISSNPDLRTALEELRRTRTMLRSQRRMRAPRNFTLTPEMVKPRPALRAYPALRLASALASLLLVFVLLGDFFTGAPPVSTVMSQPDIAAQSEVARQAQPEAPPGMGGETGDVYPKAAEMPQGTPALTEAAEPSIMMEAAPAETESPAAIAPEAAPIEPADRLLEEPFAVEEPGLEGAVAAADDGVHPERVQDERVPDERPSLGIDLMTLRVLEVGLFLVALGSGLLALYLRRIGSG